MTQVNKVHTKIDMTQVNEVHTKIDMTQVNIHSDNIL